MRRAFGFLGFCVTVHGVSALTENKFKLAAAIRNSRAAADELVRERERLDNILRAADVGTWAWNMATGEVCVDERWAQLIGRTFAELEPLRSQSCSS